MPLILCWISLCSPLHDAAYHGRAVSLEVCELLLSFNADANARDRLYPPILFVCF